MQEPQSNDSKHLKGHVGSQILNFIIDKLRRARERLLLGWSSPEQIKKAGAFTSATALFVTLLEIVHLSWVTVKGSPLAYSLILVALSVGTLTVLLGCSLYATGYLRAVLENKKAEHAASEERIRTENALRIEKMEAAHAALVERMRTENALRIEKMEAAQQQMLVQCDQRALTRRLKVFRSMHLGLAHWTRDYLIRVFNSLYETNPVVPRQPSVEETVGLLVEFCNAISSGLEALYEGVRFRACVKLYVSPKELLTVARDAGTLRTWPSSNDAHFRQIVFANTAFLTLLTAHKVAWASDNLKEFHFENSSKGWEDRYKRSMSVPIRLSHIGVPGKFEIVGYIAVDCQLDPQKGPIFCNENGDPEESLRDFLLTFADLAYPIIKRGKVVAAPDLSEPDSYVTDKENFAFVGELHEAYISHRWLGFTGLKTEASKLTSNGSELQELHGNVVTFSI